MTETKTTTQPALETWPVLPDGSLVIRVTERDLARGTIDSDNCPLARAIRRQLRPRRPSIDVEHDGVKIGGHSYSYSGNFASRFDDRLVTGPETVVLERRD